MSEDNGHKSDFPIIFFGIADHINLSDIPFPFGPIDLFGLSHQRIHFIYPIDIKDYYWIFLLNEKIINNFATYGPIIINVNREKGAEFCNLKLSSPDVDTPLEGLNITNKQIILKEGMKWAFVYAQCFLL